MRWALINYATCIINCTGLGTNMIVVDCQKLNIIIFTRKHEVLPNLTLQINFIK